MQPHVDAALRRQQLRRADKPVIAAANKVENRRTEFMSAEFYELGLGEPLPLSAIQGQGTGDLLDAILASLPPLGETGSEEEAAVSIAIVVWVAF